MSQIQRYRCDVCGYVHEGPTPPEVCPVCGVGAEMFTAVGEVPSESASALNLASAGRPASAGDPSASAWRCTVCGYLHGGDRPPETCPVCSVSASLFLAEGESTSIRAPLQPSPECVVIIGAGAAGVAAAEHVRKHSGARIVLVNKEPIPPYNRLNLTRFLAREVAEEGLFLRPHAWYDERRIELTPGEVTSIDRAEHRVAFKDGSTLAYSRLILTSGSHPLVPPLPGANREGVTPVRTLAHAKAVIQAAMPGRRAVVIGGGLLGLETAAALNARGVSVTVLEGHGWLLPRQLAEPAGTILAKYLGTLGITVRTSVKVAELHGDEAVRTVRLADDSEIDAEIVLLAAGVRPNKHLALSAGLETRQGVVVSDRMATSDPDIYAAGDVAEHRGLVYGLWPVALGQGAVAGTNAGGGRTTFTGTPPANQLKVLGLPVFSLGQFAAKDGSYAVTEHQEGAIYRRLVWHDGALVGGNLLGDLRLAGALTRAVELGLQLSELPDELGSLPELARAPIYRPSAKPEAK